MRNFKPSELPAGTCIDDKVHGFWTKDSDNAWWMDAPHCSDCSEVVFDGPPTEAERQLENEVYQFHTTPSDEFFTEFEIISLPFGVVWKLALALSEEYDMVDDEGNELTVRSLIETAIEQNNDAEEREAREDL